MYNHAKHTAGFSLIEVMITLVLGLVILGMVVNVFVNTRQNHAQNERVTETLESGRFAISKLSTDLKSTGFLGGLLDATALSLDGSLTNPTINCGPTGEADWAYTVSDGTLEFIYNSTASNANTQHECIQTATFQAGTDVLAVKRVFSQDASGGLVANNVYLRSDNSTACLWFYDGSNSPGAGCPTTDYSDWLYLTHVYYIRNFAVTAGDGIPTLCRKSLTVTGGAPTMGDLCLAEGVEHFHVQFGIDTDNPRDGVANQFISNPTAAQLSAAVSAKIFVLARAKRADPTFANTKTYTLGSREIDADDNFYRRVYSTTVLLRNPMYASLFN